MPQPLLTIAVLTKLNYLRARLTDSTIVEERTPDQVRTDTSATICRVQTTEPTSPIKGDLWLKTSS